MASYHQKGPMRGCALRPRELPLPVLRAVCSSGGALGDCEHHQDVPQGDGARNPLLLTEQRHPHETPKQPACHQNATACTEGRRARQSRPCLLLQHRPSPPASHPSHLYLQRGEPAGNTASPAPAEAEHELPSSFRRPPAGARPLRGRAASAPAPAPISAPASARRRLAPVPPLPPGSPPAPPVRDEAPGQAAKGSGEPGGAGREAAGHRAPRAGSVREPGLRKREANKQGGKKINPRAKQDKSRQLRVLLRAEHPPARS